MPVIKNRYKNSDLFNLCFVNLPKIIKTIMNRIPIILAAVLTVALCGCTNRSKSEAKAVECQVEPLDSLEIRYAPALEIGTEAPDFTAQDTLGNNVSLADFRGGYVVLDFWATWCGDCRRENVTLKEVYSEYRDKEVSGSPVRFVSYSFDDDARKWKDFIAAENMEWNQVSTLVKWHDNPVSEAYSVGWIPTFYVIDPQGVIVGKAIKASRLREILQAQDK